MKNVRLREVPIAHALAQELIGQTIANVCRRLSLPEQTFFRMNSADNAKPPKAGILRNPRGINRWRRSVSIAFGMEFMSVAV